ncbi:MAG: serine hydrolase, partial [Deltaproteobacteria bacterium]|nr:serine hydrolase [Deltaproteobacteria bacterium]
MPQQTRSSASRIKIDPQKAVGLIHDYARQAMDQCKVPGMGLAVILGDEVISAAGLGRKDVGASEAVDEKTLFQVGSTTKAFTSTLVAMLADESKLSWDDPVIDHLPDFRLFDPFLTREVRVRDLMCHRTGLADHDGDSLWYLFGHPTKETIRRIRYLKPTWSLRSKFAYHNIMWAAAGAVVEAVGRQDWSEAVTERLFGPLGMSKSATTVGDLKSGADVATPHDEAAGRTRAIPLRSFDTIAAAGSILSSAHDMARWLRFHLAQGVHEGRQIISSANIQEMQLPQTIIHRGDNPHMDLFVPEETSFLTYGLGWFLYDYAGLKLAEHAGSTDGMSALVAMLPQEKLGLVVLTNKQASTLPHGVLYRALDIFLGREERDWSSQLLQKYEAALAELAAAEEETKKGRIEGAAPSLPLEGYAGTFENQMYGQAVITHQQGVLELRLLPDGFFGPLEHWHQDVFRFPVASPYFDHVWISFTLTAAGRIEGMRMEVTGILPLDCRLK